MILFTNSSRNLDNMMTHFLGKVPRPPICIKARYVKFARFFSQIYEEKIVLWNHILAGNGVAIFVTSW